MRPMSTSTRYANITATLALLLALGGTSYAVTQVTGADVKNHSLTGKDIKKESLGSKQIKGLTASDFSSSLPAGPAGPAGSAKAYGHVLANGSFDLDPTRSSGLTSLLIGASKQAGLYCFDYRAGTPVNVVATIDVGGADSRKSIASVFLGRATGCPDGSDFAVFTANSDLALSQDLPFFVAVIA